ncbi:MAG: transketolase [Bacteroidetes bacterium]|nr:transketolase [Bacteroidota bacterium]
MRVEFAQAVITLKDKHTNLVFMTGDLGYMALEKVQERYGEHFINAGVAEQNMVTVAASLAHEGFVPFAYSISPFVTLRPYEQIRTDVCLHDLPVKIVGNGGGYGYGIMGATHHNIEDIAIMRVLPNMRVYVPLTGSDVGEALDMMVADPHPNYLRLNMGAKINEVPAFAQWRKIKSGDKAVVIGTGPILENITSLPAEIVDGLEIWALSIFPFAEIPAELVARINAIGKLLTIEEHQGQCGMHEALASKLLGQVAHPISFKPLYASGYPSGRYGDQKWHQAENGLGGEGLLNTVQQFLGN